MFFPRDLTIHWSSEVATNAVMLGTAQADSHLYITSSHVRVTGDRGELWCQAQQGSNNLSSKTFFKDVCKPVTQGPQVYLVEPRCGDEDGEVEVKLHCVFWSSKSEEIKASWLLNGVEMGQPPTKGADMGRSLLTIKRDSWDKGDIYTCKVTTQSVGGGPVMRNTSKCMACSSTSLLPQLYSIQPSYSDLLAGPSMASCLLLGQHLEGATISWSRPHAGGAGTLTHHPNGTQSLLLTRPVTLDQWGTGLRLGCEATVPCHPSISLEFLLGPTSSSRKTPKVKVTRVPPGVTTPALLLCDVTDFAPRDISIHWTGKRDLHARTQTSPVTGQEVFSTLSILRLEKDEEGKDYACVVQHPTLDQPLHATEEDGEEHHGGGGFGVKRCGRGDAEEMFTMKPPPDGGLDFGVPLLSSMGRYLLRVEDLHAESINRLIYSFEEQVTSLDVGCPASPPASLRPPSFHELFRHRAANLTCVTPLANATVDWTADGRRAGPEEAETRRDAATGTRSRLRVGLRDWKATGNFSCRVRDGERETRLEISRTTGPLKPPSLQVLPASPAEACAGRDFTFFCLVKDFYPPEIAAWRRRGANEAPADEGPSCDHKRRRCSLVVAVDVAWGEWAGGTSYGCSVAHVSSDEVLEMNVHADGDPWDCAGSRFVPCGLLGDGDDLEPEEEGSALTTVSTFVVLFLLLIFYSGFVTFLKVK
ncbi:class II histocompatibility antigen, B-L beta chain-like [Grus japonensis]|uniref:Class II histocompatibility antigen, B-L beta chain-like n=1 Tax=Grus japonensis TaxID=30415 RepID=A0ABC9XWV4_GRUJA